MLERRGEHDCSRGKVSGVFVGKLDIDKSNNRTAGNCHTKSANVIFLGELKFEMFVGNDQS